MSQSLFAREVQTYCDYFISVLLYLNYYENRFSRNEVRIICSKAFKIFQEFMLGIIFIIIAAVLLILILLTFTDYTPIIDNTYRILFLFL